MPPEQGPRGEGVTREGARVSYVSPGSPADRAGLREGERVLTLDGEPLRDLIDWSWRGEATRLETEVEPESGAPSRHVVLERAPDEPFGLGFDGVVFEGVRTCDNDCAFCFLLGLPRGLRRSLYVRDDDYRLSFYEGNFITLTDLDEDDIARVIETRLSPLYVSLHAVDPGVREELVACRHRDRAVETLVRLLGAGIDVHVQVVLVPGVNDGGALDRTLAWLAPRDGVRSVGVVPVGYTRHHPRISTSYDDPGSAGRVLERLEDARRGVASERGRAWLQAADEFYLTAGRPVPSSDAYDGYPQYENGIGMTRWFLDEVEGLRGTPMAEAARVGGERGPALLVTGELFAPVLRGALASLGTDVPVRAAPNRFLGGNVSVAGLLTGDDVASTIRTEAASVHADARAGAPVRCAVPRPMLDRKGRTLDEWDLRDLTDAAGIPVSAVGPGPRELLGWLASEAGGDA